MNPLKRFINFLPIRRGKGLRGRIHKKRKKKSLIGTNANRKSNKMMWQNICDYPFAIVFGFARGFLQTWGSERDCVFIALINNQVYYYILQWLVLHLLLLLLLPKKLLFLCYCFSILPPSDQWIPVKEFPLCAIAISKLKAICFELCC